MTTPDTQAPQAILGKEEIAFLIKAMWRALRAPGWTFANRKDLEKIGEAIFAGKDLRDIDDRLYDRIFPHLVTIATSLGNTLLNYERHEPASAPAAPTPTTARIATAPAAASLPTLPASAKATPTPQSAPTTPTTAPATAVPAPTPPAAEITEEQGERDQSKVSEPPLLTVVSEEK